MLRAEFPPELDAVETHELGLSIAFPKEKSECVEIRLRAETQLV